MMMGCTSVCARERVREYMCVRVYACMYVCACVCVYVCVYTCVRVCSHQAGLHVVTLNAEILPKAQNCWMTRQALKSHAHSVTRDEQTTPAHHAHSKLA